MSLKWSWAGLNLLTQKIIYFPFSHSSSCFSPDIISLFQWHVTWEEYAGIFADTDVCSELHRIAAFISASVTCVWASALQRSVLSITTEFLQFSITFTPPFYQLTSWQERDTLTAEGILGPTVNLLALNDAQCLVNRDSELLHQTRVSWRKGDFSMT